MSIDEAKAALEDAMVNKAFWEAGNKVVIEEFLEWQEASVLAFVDGKTIVPMLAAQDHKRIKDGDEWKNTGWMWAYSPTPFVNKIIHNYIYNKILVPMVKWLAKEWIKYKWVLYAWLILTSDWPKVVEFNVRFWDPEIQAILPLLKTDLFEIFQAIIDEKLDQIEIKWEKNKSAVSVVMASEGYPESYEKGKEITGISEIEKKWLLVFHAWSKKQKDWKLVTNGGRNLNIVSVQKTLEKAIDDVYKNIDTVNFEWKYYRKDIAQKAITKAKP